MCGRYATSQTSDDLIRDFGADLVSLGDELDPDFNMAPTKQAPVLVGRRADGAADGAPAQRELLSARWGLIPSWAKDASIGARLINARAETVAEKPSFRRAFAKRRTLVPADGYYEWYAGEPDEKGRGDKGKARKQPFFIRSKDGSPLAMAGLHEFWKDPASGEWVISFTIITTTAEDAVGHLHERMPLLVDPGGWDDWLDPAPRATEELMELLTPAAPGTLDAYPVSTAVNHVRNNGPELIAPL